ncbi:hypothetical protein AOLI_G00298530 [Acnodon oligacanthus]
MGLPADQRYTFDDNSSAQLRRPRHSLPRHYDTHRQRPGYWEGFSPPRHRQDSSHPYDYGPTDLTHHAIDTSDAKPIKLQPYRTSPATQVLLQQEVDKLLEQGIIEESHSPWSAPVVVVRKKDGTHRFCVDYR